MRTDPFFTSEIWLFLLVFAAFWCGMLWAISRISGWAELAERYPGSSEDGSVQWKRFQSASLRALCNYNNCLWLGTSPHGLHLKTDGLFLVGFAHPPIRIPWHAIENAEADRMWWRDVWRLRIRSIGFPVLVNRGALMGAEPWLPPSLFVLELFVLDKMKEKTGSEP